MNDPISVLRERLPQAGRPHRAGLPRSALQTPDAVQILTAKLLLFTGIGTALEAWDHRSRGSRVSGSEGDEYDGPAGAVRPAAWAPAVLGAVAAVAHAVHGFAPSERTRLATRTLDVAVVAGGLLGLAETLAAARRDRELPDVGAVSLACAGLLGILIDRTDSRNEAERERLERRARVVDRLVPRRRARLDRIVVHV